MNASPLAAEAERQRQLVEAILAPTAGDRPAAISDTDDRPAAISDTGDRPAAIRETGERAARGLRAYRDNADAIAERALASAYPSVSQLLGEEAFRRLAREFFRAAPPLHGDLGEWGAGLAAWIAGNEALSEWPYLTDCARLDWAMHLCERAEDSSLDAASLERLSDTDPWRLAVEFTGGLAVIESSWPIAAIHAAHAAGGEALFDAAREAIAVGLAESVVVSRRGWKAHVTPVDAVTARWTRELLDGTDLDAALLAAGESWDFAAWLARALQAQWVKGIRVLRD